MQRFSVQSALSIFLFSAACGGTFPSADEFELDAQVAADASQGDARLPDAGVVETDAAAPPCVAGQHVEDGDCVPDNTCPLGCSGHGSCGDDVCSCELGYAGAGCEECAAGFERGADGRTCVNSACGTCASPMVCLPTGECCDDACAGGDSQCEDGYERRCAAGVGGCPTWTSWFSCGAGGCGDEQRCAGLGADVSVDQWGTRSEDFVLAMTVGKSGEVIVSGFTHGQLGDRARGSADGFLASRNTNPLSNWVRQFGSMGSDRASGVFRTSGGELVVGGEAGGDLDTGMSGGADGFLLKFSSTGSQTKSVRFGSDRQERVYTLVQGQDGNAYATGYTFGGINGPSNGDQDCFVAKFDPAGEQVWAMQFGGLKRDVCENVTADAAGNVYAVGFTAGDIEGERNSGNDDAFLAKVDVDGTLQWVRLWGFRDDDGASTVRVGPDGGIFVAGIARATLNRTGTGLAFLGKWSASGDELWLTQWGGNATYLRAMAFDASGALYTAGSTRVRLDESSNAGGLDAFVSKWTFGPGTTHTRVWTKQYGTAESDEVYALAIDAAGTLYLGGSTMGSFPGYTNAGAGDNFVLRISAP